MLRRGPYLKVVAIYGPALHIPLGVIPQAVCSGTSRQRRKAVLSKAEGYIGLEIMSLV